MGFQDMIAGLDGGVIDRGPSTRLTYAGPHSLSIRLLKIMLVTAYLQLGNNMPVQDSKPCTLLCRILPCTDDLTLFQQQHAHIGLPLSFLPGLLQLCHLQLPLPQTSGLWHVHRHALTEWALCKDMQS